jgi:D-beta-D-heptose 7-phosphate kinase/D-beta-D-heptose 1-phosphate adenosyltransferase
VLTRPRATEIVGRFPSQAVLVVGDVMLDRFVWGEVTRISPEAPVPVVKIRRETATLGGAGNVVSNLTALGAAVRFAGVVGEDEAGRRVRERLASAGVDVRGLLNDPTRPTTLKMRIVAHNQQVVRVDTEEDGSLPEPLAGELLRQALALLDGVSALMISDYDKGVLSPGLLRPLLAAARAAAIPVVVDPKRAHFPLYQPVTVITPNQAEAARATAIEIRGEADVERAGRRILEMLATDALLVTRGERGMALFERDRETTAIPTRSREVYDVTGAGDTVASVLALALPAGATMREAAELANFAAGIVVGKIGTATVSREELLAAIV